MLTIIFSRSSISSSVIFLRLGVVPLDGAMVVVELIGIDITEDGTVDITATGAFLFLSRIGESGTVPLAILGNGS